MHERPTIYLRQAGLTCNSKFCYLYFIRCWGQGAVSNPRPIANIYVGCHFKDDSNDIGLMDIGQEFLTVKELLDQNKGQRLVDELIWTIQNYEVDFRSNNSSLTKEHLIDVYSTRQSIQQEINKDNFVDGYSETLLNLKHTEFTEIDIVSYNSDNGGFTLFTDRKRKTIIGLLKSRRTLTEIRDKFKEQIDSTTNYRTRENLFIKGHLKRV